MGRPIASRDTEFRIEHLFEEIDTWLSTQDVGLILGIPVDQVRPVLKRMTSLKDLDCKFEDGWLWWRRPNRPSALN